MYRKLISPDFEKGYKKKGAAGEAVEIDCFNYAR